MDQFIVPILTLTGLGLFFALALTFASKKFAVSQDPRIQELLEKLPGANCGACGLAGCAGFAQALSKGELSLDNCKACTKEQAVQIAKILKVELPSVEEKVISLRCFGGKRAKDKFVYQGIKDCQAAAQLLGGQKLCAYACLGFGNCQRACPFGAIAMSAEGLPIINGNLCTGCGKCIPACPRSLLVLIPRKSRIDPALAVDEERQKAGDGRVYVGCSSPEPAKVIARLCQIGCIACKECAQVCPVEAIKVVDNLAVIDYDKCTFCGKCVHACPRKIIKEI